MTDLAGWTVAAPLGAAAVAYMAPERRVGRRVAQLASITIFLLVGALTVQVATAGVQHTAIGGWAAPLGITLRVDGLSAVMLLMTALGGLVTALYASGYYPLSRAGEAWDPQPAFWPLFLFLWAGVNALFVTADVFNVYVALELMTLSAVALVVLANERVALGAAIRYLLAAFAGSLAYLLGVALLYGAFHTLDMGLLAERLAPGPAAWLGVALVTTGLALKSALFPLHFWLPRAHASAPAPVSALLSSLVVTAAFYLVLRLWVQVFAGVLTYQASQFLGALGALAILWGSLEAIRQQHLKVMIAYSTVAQVGYLFLVLPLLGPGTPADAGSMAWDGAVYHAISHAMAKAALFLAAGSIAMALGDDRIVGIRGIAVHLPVSTYAFGIAGLSLVGLPPTGGFVAKWMMLSSSLASGQWWWAVVILLGGLLTAGYVFLVLSQELSLAEGDHPAEFRPVPRPMEYAALILALTALALGLRATEALELLNIGSPFSGVTGGAR